MRKTVMSVLKSVSILTNGTSIKMLQEELNSNDKFNLHST